MFFNRAFFRQCFVAATRISAIYFFATVFVFEWDKDAGFCVKDYLQFTSAKFSFTSHDMYDNLLRQSVGSF